MSDPHLEPEVTHVTRRGAWMALQAVVRWDVLRRPHEQPYRAVLVDDIHVANRPRGWVTSTLSPVPTDVPLPTGISLRRTYCWRSPHKGMGLLN